MSLKTYRSVRIEDDVFDMLHELKYDYRERNLSDTLRHIFAELGIEPYDEDDYDEDEDEG